jgi:hypothetical protein
MDKSSLTTLPGGELDNCMSLVILHALSWKNGWRTQSRSRIGLVGLAQDPSARPWSFRGRDRPVSRRTSDENRASLGCLVILRTYCGNVVLGGSTC